MARYIDADVGVAVINASDLGEGMKSLLRSLLSSIGTADVVEVVRCKDCEYWQDNNAGYPHEYCKWNTNETPDADDFCSCGERQ